MEQTIRSSQGQSRPRRHVRAQLRAQQRRRLWQRAALLLAVVVFSTFAARGSLPGVAQALGIVEGPRPMQLMPFEVPGQSFPGSALFYLDEPLLMRLDIAELRKEEGTLETAQYEQEFGAGATAKAFQSAGSGLDKARALRCLSLAVYYEAASESQAGQEAVAQVVLNRVAHPAYPSSICGVVFQGSERRTGCQFTFTCDGSMGRQPSRASFARAQSVALAALAGHVYRPVGYATHYHTHAVNPYWASSLDFIGSIGAHRFYRWKGSAGQAAAFTNAYSGREPVAGPNPRQVSSDFERVPVPSTPPPNSAIGVSGVASAPKVGSAMAGTSETGQAEAARQSDILPESGGVREEYENSGQWIRQPGDR